ncbi:MAG: GNAT family N-acetyltransferase [Intrasporangiaceae bacterium]|nr:GNAT family N-acetyltransferase [Intrasporangiaceae bacterium]
MILRPALAVDDELVLAWNDADVRFLAPMDGSRLSYLRERASGVEVIDVDGTPAGFVITFVEGSDYDSENYRWFSAREPRFHYVDRIVIDPGHRGQGLATRVYAALAGRHPDRPLLAEVNYAPPNPISMTFHSGFGFEEVGRLGDRSYGVVLLRYPPQDSEVGLL